MLHISPIGNVTSSVGRSAQLTCIINRMTPNSGSYKVAWLKMDADSEPTLLTIGLHSLVNEEDGKYRVTQQDGRKWVLHISRVSVEDRGRYMCQVNAQHMASAMGFLDVFEPPVINENLTSSDTVVDELKRASLRCVTSGHPAPNVTWRRENGAQLNLGLYGGKKNSSSVWEGGFLNITQVTRDDMGAYLCIASNGVPPSVSKRILLQVNFRPKIRVTNKLVQSYVGADVEFECRIEASPKPEVFWTTGNGQRLDEQLAKIERQGYPIIMNDSNDVSVRYRKSKLHLKKYYFDASNEEAYWTVSRLTIRRLESADFGSYKCVARNDLGEKEGLVRLYEIPMPTLPPTTTTTTTTTTHLPTPHRSIDATLQRSSHHRKTGDATSDDNHSNKASSLQNYEDNDDTMDIVEDLSYLEQYYPTRVKKITNVASVIIVSFKLLLLTILFSFNLTVIL